MTEWTSAAQRVYNETQGALQLVYDSLNQGQQNKILKEPAVKELFDHYQVTYDT